MSCLDAPLPSESHAPASTRPLSAGLALCLWLAASAAGAQPEVPNPGAVPPALERGAAAPSRVPEPTPRTPPRTASGSAASSDAAQVEELELAKTRDRRRAARRAKLEALWGDLIHTPPALVELQLHGWRMARLRRLGRLAASSNTPALVERITRLETKEEARHVKQLNRLKRQPEPPSTAPHPRPLPQRATSTAAPASERVSR